MTVAAFVPLLVEDKFRARRPPLDDELVFGKLPVVAFVADTQIKPARAAPLTNLCFVAQVAVEAPGMALHGRFAAPVRYERTSPSALHVGNSGSAGHGKNFVVRLLVDLSHRSRRRS